MEIRIESGRYRAAYRPEGVAGNQASLSRYDLGELAAMISQARTTIMFDVDRATLTLDDSEEKADG